jgi:DNA-binding NarL/FixJ family response regulator
MTPIPTAGTPTADTRTAQVRVLVVDDHAVVREGLLSLLETMPGIECVGSAIDGLDAVAQVARLQPDVVLMDLAMPRLDGIEATRRIRASHPDVRVLALTSHADDGRIRAAMEAGARGYLLKHVGPDQLIEAVHAVHAGDVPLDPRAGRILLESRRGGEPQLTPRETEVLRLVARGRANKQIARELGIAERTVKAHLTRLMQGIGVTDRVAAALWAQDNLAP